MAEPQEQTEVAQEQPQEQHITNTAPSKSADSSAKKKLTELVASAELQYSRKNYSKAAEIYSNATEQQASINGEDNPENAELLFQYGRCLYHVAVQTADVLGGKVAAEKKKSKTPKEANGKTKEAPGATPSNGAVSSSSDAKGLGKEKESDGSNPYFSITGDENWTDSEDEEAEGEEQEEEDDDFTNAYDVLEYARVLFQRKLDAISAPDSDIDCKGKEKASTELSPEARHIKERLADTRSLQAEICLEHERFGDAVTDARANLDLCQELYGIESNLVAEAHYKLSLALEFASAEVPDEAEKGNVDMKMREEAADEMEKAIKSVRARIERERKAVDEQSDAQAKSKQTKKITETKELLKELEDRLVDLRAPPQNPLEGIFDGLLGPKSGASAQKVEEATKSANDLSGLVKKKKKEPEKRKRDDEDELAADGANRSGVKKARVEDA